MTVTLRRMAGAILLAAMAVTTVRGDEEEETSPFITLSVTPGDGQIKGYGTWGKKGYEFQSITMFATPAGGGKIWQVVCPAPDGKNWPTTGTLNMTVPNGKYTVWAVLNVRDDSNKIHSWGSNVIKNHEVKNGKEPTADEKKNPVAYYSGYPKVVGDKIQAEGTFDLEQGNGLGIQQFTLPVGGGKMDDAVDGTVDTEKTPATWVAVSKSLPASQQRHVFIIASSGNVLYTAPVVELTP